MTIDQVNQKKFECRQQEIDEENELLMLQLHQVQEELERCYLRNEELERSVLPRAMNNAASSKGLVDCDLANALAENRRLRALAEVQREVYRLEQKNALNAKLGDLLIRAVESPKAVVSLPGQLGKIWRGNRQQKPPAELGGNGFGKVIEAYDQGGFDAVAELMNGRSIAPTVQANGYTSLGRHLMERDRASATEAARRAHALDPKSFRLKWLAFRLHDAGDVIEADAMLDILPSDTKFSESESRQARRLREDARNARQVEAELQAGLSDRRVEFEREVSRLEFERREQAKLAADRLRETSALQTIRAQLEQRISSIEGQLGKATRQVDERNQEVDALKRTKGQLEQKASALERRLDDAATQLTERSQQINALTQAMLRLEQMILERTQQLDEAESRVVERDQELQTLEQTRLQLKEKNAALATQLEEAATRASERGHAFHTLELTALELQREKSVLETRLNEVIEQMTERCREVEALKQIRVHLEDGRSMLEKRHDEIVKLLAESSKETGALKQAKAYLEQEKLVSAETHNEVARRLAQYTEELQALTRVKEHLEQENTDLVGRFNSASQLAEERLQQIDELQQRIESCQINEKSLAARQQLMRENLGRAEAQLDLIKEMLLREPLQ